MIKHQAKALYFITTEDGCMVPLSHALNVDGYFRKAWGNDRTNNKRSEMFHRTIYRMHFGEIPEGHEVDHLCKFRCCCNPKHLRAISKIEHTIETNKTRTNGIGHPLKA